MDWAAAVLGFSESSENVLFISTNIMEEDPVRHYTSKSECMANASVKHSLIIEAYPTYGYQVEQSHFDCVQTDNLTNS